MKPTNLAEEPKGWVRFNLSVGGFVAKGCRWRPVTGQVLFPQRYDRYGYTHPVVHARAATVKRLRALLESGEAQLPRNRRPCELTPHLHGYSHSDANPWMVFDFTVRGFTILGCRWQPQSGSVQLPVTFIWDDHRAGYRKKQVVCAFGSHINRLREALEANLQAPSEGNPAEVEALAAE